MKIHYMKIQKFVKCTSPGSVSENSNYEDYHFWICWRIKPNQPTIFYDFHSVLPLYYNNSFRLQQKLKPLKIWNMCKKREFSPQWHLKDTWGGSVAQREAATSPTSCTKDMMKRQHWRLGLLALNLLSLSQYNNTFSPICYYIFTFILLSLFSRFFKKLWKLLIFLKFPGKPSHIHLNTSTFHAHIL